ncbi:hypothetical protein ACFL0T_00215 [Candidatus Omnitrophota bacterium]
MRRDNIEIYKLLIIIIFIAGISAIFLVQFATPTLYGTDGYLHIRMAQFLRDLGPHYKFHWTKYSIFYDKFSDKDFLYHLLLIPFTWCKDIFFGAKIAAAFFASSLFLVFFFLLNKYADNRVHLFFMLAFFFSASFLHGISLARPMTLVILIILLSTHFAILQKHAWVFLLSIAYSLVHVTGPIIIIYIAIVECVRYKEKGLFNSKTVLAAILGVIVGFLIHPNFPNNLTVFYLNAILVPVHSLTGNKIGIGAEFMPLDTRQVILNYPVVLLGVVFMMYIAFFKSVETRFHTRVFFIVSLPFFIISFVSKRYAWHSYPFMLVAFACLFSDYLRTYPRDRLRSNILLMIISIVLILNSVLCFKKHIEFDSALNKHFEFFGFNMKHAIPKGETVFHSAWSDSQYFIGLNPDNDYMVTLDPIYMHEKDPYLYKIYRDLSFGRVSDPYDILQNVFGLRYGYVNKKWRRLLYDQIRVDSRFEIIFEDRLGAIFKLS